MAKWSKTVGHNLLGGPDIMCPVHFWSHGTCYVGSNFPIWQFFWSQLDLPQAPVAGCAQWLRYLGLIYTKTLLQLFAVTVGLISSR